MNCTVCKRSLAPTLSICPSCGAMMNDTVREELESKIMTATPRRMEMRPETATERTPPRPARRQDTDGLVAPKTSPTLVEFQTKNATLPDWRLQLQNLVQQRKGVQSAAAELVSAGGPTTLASAAAITAPSKRLESTPGIESADPRVVNAMRRIEESRKAFLPVENGHVGTSAAKSIPNHQQRFNVVSPTMAASPARAAVTAQPKPQLVMPLLQMAKRIDTNKLPPLAKAIEHVVKIEDPAAEKINTGDVPIECGDIKRIHIRADHAEIEDPEKNIVDDEIDDLAPVSMRFSAGVFDLIIGAFAAMLMLSPLAFTSGNWFSASGLLTFVSMFSIVMFLYMTVSLGFCGKTLGMRLFSLELVDAVENQYPTMRQAAVNSSVFLLSLVFAGAGFLTLLFNEEKRALHDLASGTILVKEF